MHVGCLGVTGYCLGSTLFELVFDGRIDKSPARALENLWEMIKAEYSTTEITNRLTSLGFSMFYNGASNWPFLSCRAAEARSLVPVLEGICKAMMDGSDHDEHRLRALASLSRMYRIVLEGDHLFLTTAESEALLEAIGDHLLHSHWLLCEAQEEEILKWPLMTKHHILWHIGDMSRVYLPGLPGAINMKASWEIS